MPSFHLQFVTLMNIIRIFGVFPYTWRKSEIKHSSLSSPSSRVTDERVLTKLTWKVSTKWKIWSGVLYLICFGFIIFNFIYLKKLVRKRTGSSKTLEFAYSVYDCFLYINILLVYAYCAKEYVLMNKILNFGEQFLEKLRIDHQSLSNFKVSFLVPYLIIIGQISLIVCLIIYERNNFENTFHLFSYLSITFINGTLVATLSTLFYSIIIVISSIYSNIFRHLCFRSDDLKSMDLNEFLTNELEEEANRIKYVAISKEEICSHFRENVDSEINKSVDDPKEGLLTRDDIKFCTQNLLALYTFQNLVNRYFAFLLSFFMMFLMSTAIIAFCYVFMSMALARPLLYLFNTIIPFLCLVNSPYTVFKEVCAYYSNKIDNF